MRLQAAANHFNNSQCLDAYSGLPSFFGQFSLYDDTKRDSEAGERRVISVAPGTSLPARRVVTAAGTKWIIGHGNPDTFRGSTLRIGYVVHEATELSRIRTLAEVCLDQPGFTAWCGRAWIKNLADNEHSSRLTPQFHVHFAQGEAVQPRQIVTSLGRLLIVRSTWQGPAGTLIALADQLEDPAVEFATVATGAWDPVQDAPAAGSVEVRTVRGRWQSLYAYEQAQAPTFVGSDIQLVFAKSTLTARAGMLVTLSDGQWKLTSADSMGDVWACRAVRHA